jgi:NAD-dependent deacetylase
MKSDDTRLASVAAWLRSAERIVVFTGAGLSKASGIPTYRDGGGLWTKAGNMRFAYADALAADTQAFLDFWAHRRAELESAQPNPGHLALAQLQQAKPLTTLATQNVDGLLAKAGAREVLELHGNLFRTRCEACGAKDPQADERSRCLACDSPNPSVRPDVVMFGEMLDPGVIARAEFDAKSCDVLLAVGTSAVVYPAAGLIEKAKSRGARVAVINAEPIELAHLADAQAIGASEVLLPRLMAMAGIGG